MLSQDEKRAIHGRLDQVVMAKEDGEWEYPGAKFDLAEAVLWEIDPVGDWPQAKVNETVAFVATLL